MMMTNYEDTDDTQEIKRRFGVYTATCWYFGKFLFGDATHTPGKFLCKTN